MKRTAIAVAACVLGLGTAAVAASPAYASYYPVGCEADGMSIVGNYPAYGDQDVYTCEFSPYYRSWEYSHTCPPGTEPVASLDGPRYHYQQEFYISHTSCEAG